MAGFGSIGTEPFDDQITKSPPRVFWLSVLMAFVLSGALATLPLIHQSGTWIVWAAITIIIYLSAKEMPLARLLLPFMPYFAWLCFYLIWGLIVSPVTDIAFANKTVVTTVALAICMAILTAKSHYLRTFANCAQFSVVANLLLWILMPMSSQITNLVMRLANQTDVDLLGFYRFGGMVGNANMMGYVCLIATILSVLAVPWIAWIGRLSCLPLLYVAASRKSFIMYLVILVLYVVIIQRRNAKFWVAAVVLVFSSVMVLILNDGLRENSRLTAEDPAIARMLDVQEKESTLRGEETRVDLFQSWFSTLRDEPWYGYGLQTMSGSLTLENHPDIVLVRAPYPLGTHNTYLGVWVDVGPVGFIAFIMMMLYYAKLCLFSECEPIARWVLVSLLLVNLTFLFLSHNHLFCFEGKVAFALFFLLPSSAGLWELSRSLSRNRASHPMLP